MQYLMLSLAASTVSTELQGVKTSVLKLRYRMKFGMHQIQYHHIITSAK